MNDPSEPARDSAGPVPEQQALQDALAGLMSSVARLGVGRGLPYAAVEELLRQAFVQAAAQAHPGMPEHRKVSRISTTTGINRREVTRIVQQTQNRLAVPKPRSLASEVFAHWRTQAPYRGSDGQPVTLQRQGPVSFESLSQAVTRDVHPRGLLDELVRLGLVLWDEESDQVSLQRETFVASGDLTRQLGFLGDNVGDHLRAAVENVLGAEDRLHFEQAVFADGLTAASIASVRPQVHAQWQALLAALVPALQARVAADATQQPAPQGRLRVGLYTYHEGGAPDAPAVERVLRPARAKRKS